MFAKIMHKHSALTYVRPLAFYSLSVGECSVVLMLLQKAERKALKPRC